MPTTPHSTLPAHCGTCGTDWPAPRPSGAPSTQRCPACGGLSCRADTTDPVAPDPPCVGSAARLAGRST